MKQKCIGLLAVLLTPFIVMSQANPVSTPAQTKTTVNPKNLPKDAKVDVSIADAKSGNMLSSEIIVFKSLNNGTEFQGLSDSTGRFSIRLPQGSKYEVFILGFKDSISYITLDIPALKDNAYYNDKFPFVVDIQFEAPKSFVFGYHAS